MPARRGVADVVELDDFGGPTVEQELVSRLKIHAVFFGRFGGDVGHSRSPPGDHIRQV